MSIAPETEVRWPRRVGCLSSSSAKRIAAAGPSITVQGMRWCCTWVPAHSKKVTAMRPVAPPSMALWTSGERSAST